MNNHSRLMLSCLLAGALAATICSSACNRLRCPDTSTHSADKHSPHSLIDGRTIRIIPYDASFEIPESWLSPRAIPGEPTKNLYFSWEELDDLSRHNGGDEEDAQVLDSVLLFQDCAAHFGDQAWGNYRWNDLQARIYITDLSPQQLSMRVAKEGLAEASTVFEHAEVASGKLGEWDRRILVVLDAPEWSDFSLGKCLEFYYRPFGNKTVVFVFLHAGGFDGTVDEIVNSFKWPR